MLTRHWQNLSPALRRYYRASLWPSLLFLTAAALHEWATRQAGLATPVRAMLALAPVLCMGWMFARYLHFLRDCDELERRIELHALAWAAGLGLIAALAAMLLLDAGVVAWPAKLVASLLALVITIGYALVRALLHRRYP